MNKFYKFLLTISSTLWFLAIWVVWYIFNLTKCESFKFEISIWLGCLITVVVPVFFSLVLKIFIRFLSKEDIKNVQSCNLADNEFLPVYLGYFFVALVIDNWKLLIVVYVLILIFTFVSNTQYFNPTYLIFGYHTYHAETEQGTHIILIIKGKIIRNKNEIKNMKFYRLNDTTYISRGTKIRKLVRKESIEYSSNKSVKAKMKKTFTNFLFVLILSLVIGFIACFYGKNIPISTTLAILEVLTNISSILFGVMGIWLSLIWGKKSKEQVEGILYIKKTLVSSFLTITVFLSCKQIYPVLIQIDFFSKVRLICRGILFFISIELTFFTIISVLFVILSFDFFSFDKDVSDRKSQELKDKNNALFSLTQNMEQDE